MSHLKADEIALFHAGDEVMFRRVVTEYSPRLLAFLQPFAADLDDAHDLLQDMWHRAYKKRRTFSGSGTLLGWLYAIGRSMGLAARDRRATRDRVVVDPTRHVAGPGLTPETAMERAELRRSVGEALMELGDREREVVVLRLLQQRSTRETADILGCAEGTVKASLHHALEKLQSSMEVWVQ